MNAKIIFIAIFCLLFFWLGASTAFADEWTAQTSGLTNDLNAISCPAEQICYVVGGAPFIGGEGVILKTNDGGNTWLRQTIPLTNPLRGISCPTEEICYAAGDGGALIKTVNGGNTWILLARNTSAAEQYYWDIAAIDHSNAVAVGNAGAVYRTSDAGANWNRVSSGASENLHKIFFNMPLAFIFLQVSTK